MNIYITGDKHGNFDFLPHWCEKQKTSKEDILIILGDAGLNYYLDDRDKKYKEIIKDLPITLLCVRGNHEARPKHIKGMKIEYFFKGFVYREDGYDNILYASDGQTYIINNRTFLIIGGAYSVDKYYRLERGYCWFEDEQLSFNEQEEIFKLIKGIKYDYVLTHTCPIRWEPRELFLDVIDQSTVDKNTEIWLSEVEKNIKYDKWFFGHYHGEKDIYNDGKVMMLYRKIIKL